MKLKGPGSPGAMNLRSAQLCIDNGIARFAAQRDSTLPLH
jgi:hypothetical protein